MSVEFEDGQAGGSVGELAQRSQGQSFFVRLAKKAGIKSEVGASFVLTILAIIMLGVSALIILFYVV